MNTARGIEECLWLVMVIGPFNFTSYVRKITTWVTGLWQPSVRCFLISCKLRSPCNNQSRGARIGSLSIGDDVRLKKTQRLDKLEVSILWASSRSNNTNSRRQCKWTICIASIEMVHLHWNMYKHNISVTFRRIFHYYHSIHYMYSKTSLTDPLHIYQPLP